MLPSRSIYCALSHLDSAGNGHEADLGTVLSVDPLILDYAPQDFDHLFSGDYLSAQPSDLSWFIARVLSIATPFSMGKKCHGLTQTWLAIVFMSCVHQQMNIHHIEPETAQVILDLLTHGILV